MNEQFVRNIRAWSLLALPLAAVVVVALMFAWGHGSSQDASAASPNGPDYVLEIDVNGDTTADCDTGGGPTKCNVDVGATFEARINLVKINDVGAGYTGTQGRILSSAGLTQVNRAGVGEIVNCAGGIQAEDTADVTDVDDSTFGCSNGVGQGPRTDLGVHFEEDIMCGVTPSAETVSMPHGNPLDTHILDDIGAALDDTHGPTTEVLNVNCVPGAQNINVNVQATDFTPKKLSASCVLVFAVINTAPPGSPPVLVNLPVDAVSDNNAKAACDAAIGGPLSDSNPAVGNYTISVSGGLLLANGTDWLVTDVQAGTDGPGNTYNLDGDLEACDLDGQNCSVTFTQERKTGQLVANLTDPTGSVDNADGDGNDFCINVYDDPPVNANLVDSACDTDLDNEISLEEPAGPYSVELDVSALDAAVVLPGGVTKDDSCDLSLGAAQSCKVPFTVTPSLPINLKLPALQNLFLTAQGAKLPPNDCESGTDGVEFTHEISNHPSSINKYGEVQQVAGFEFEVWFDEQWICVDIAPGDHVTNNPAIQCLNDEADGFARIGCFTVGKPSIDDSSTELAVITVKPEPELYSQIVANQDNGIAVQLLNKACNLTDQQGHDIAKQKCPDSSVTIRWLEGDVNGDCSVDAADGQILAFRWGAGVGSLAYNQRFDLEPSGTLKFDGDIDIKDVQFVFGRTGSTCGAPHPDQDPVNPKETSP